MPLTQTAARDQMLTLYKTEVDANAPGLVTIYDDTKVQVPQGDPAVEWVRVSVRHLDSRQAALGGGGVRRYTRNGVVTAQIFTVRGDGLTRADVLSAIIKAAWEGVSTPNGVWFRNVRSVEVGEDGPWFNVNVIADFEYDEVR